MQNNNHKNKHKHNQAVIKKKLVLIFYPNKFKYKNINTSNEVNNLQLTLVVKTSLYALPLIVKHLDLNSNYFKVVATHTHLYLQNT